MQMLAFGRHLCPSRGVCDTSWWKNSAFTMLLKTSHHPLPIEVTHGGVRLTYRCQWPSFLLLSLLTLETVLPMDSIIIVLWFVRISTSILILFLNFYFWFFCKILNCFQLLPSISICDMLCWPFLFLFFWLFFFLSLLLNWLFFSILPFNKRIIFIFFTLIIILLIFLVLLFN